MAEVIAGQRPSTTKPDTCTHHQQHMLQTAKEPPAHKQLRPPTSYRLPSADLFDKWHGAMLLTEDEISCKCLATTSQAHRNSLVFFSAWATVSWDLRGDRYC